MDTPTAVPRRDLLDGPVATTSRRRTLRVLELVSGFPKLSETFIVDQVLGLRARDAEVDIWALDDPTESTVAPEVAAHDLLARTRYLRLPTATGSPDDWLLRFERANGIVPSDLERYDVVHLNFGPVHLAVAPLLDAAEVPLVASFYGYDLASFVVGQPNVYQPLFRRAEAVTAVSESGRRRLVELGCPPDRAHVQRAGVRLGPRPTTHEGRTGGQLELLVVARLVEKKGVDDALRMLQQVRRPARLRILGDGPLRPELESLADELGVGDRVSFDGAVRRDRIDQALSEADFVVQLSRTAADGDQEGIPVSLVMAAAAGVPILATRHSGIPELVIDQVGGLLVDERDALGAAAALERLADDAGLRRRLGAGARATVERDFDQDRLDDQLHHRLVAATRAGLRPDAAVRRRPVGELRRALLDAAGPTAGECPVCDVAVTFPSSTAACPACGASSATRTVARFLIDRSDVLGPSTRVLTVDADPHLVHELTQLCASHDVVVTDGARPTLDAAAGPYDLVIAPPGGCGTTTRRLADVVAPGGWVVGTAPLDELDGSGHEAAMRRSGLTVLRHDPWDLLEVDELRRQGIDGGLVVLVGVGTGPEPPAPAAHSPRCAVVVAAGPDPTATTESVRAALHQRVPVAEVVVATCATAPWAPSGELASHPRVRVTEHRCSEPVERLRAVAGGIDADLIGLVIAGELLADHAVDAAVRATRRAADAGLVVGDRLLVRDGALIGRHDLPEPYHRLRIDEVPPGSFVHTGRDPSVACHAGGPIVLGPPEPAAPAASATTPAAARPLPRRTLRIVVRHNPDKAGPLLGALRDAGHELVNDLGAAGDIVLSDLYPNHGQIWELMERVGRTILYPHSAWPTLHCDGIYPVHPSVEAYFVVGEGCREVMQALDFPAPVHTVGWPFGELRPLRPTPGRRVLFGAHHPDRLGHLARRQKEDNERIVDELVAGGFDVTVRHIGSLRENGLRRLPGVTYHQAGVRSAAITRPADLDLEAADVVVSAGTFAHRATALGIPVVTCGQEEWAGDGMRPDQRVRLRTWPNYAHLLRYPFDADTDLADTVRRAATDIGPAQEWRRRFIGEPFDAATFVRRFEEVVG